LKEKNYITKLLPKDPYIKFIILFIGTYLILNYFNEFYIGITSKGGLYVPFLDEHLNYIKWWRSFSIESTAKILRYLGHTVLTNEIQLKVIGRAGFRLVYSCLGYGIMSAFVAFCISFPSPFKSRFGFIIMGLIWIQIANIARFVLISLYWKRYNTFFGLDHHTLFNTLIYLLLAICCYLWIRYSVRKENA
jgi:exosortase/archaeosortase family protein